MHYPRNSQFEKMQQKKFYNNPKTQAVQNAQMPESSTPRQNPVMPEMPQIPIAPGIPQTPRPSTTQIPDVPIPIPPSGQMPQTPPEQVMPPPTTPRQMPEIPQPPISPRGFAPGRIPEGFPAELIPELPQTAPEVPETAIPTPRPQDTTPSPRMPARDVPETPMAEEEMCPCPSPMPINNMQAVTPITYRRDLSELPLLVDVVESPIPELRIDATSLMPLVVPNPPIYEIPSNPLIPNEYREFLTYDNIQYMNSFLRTQIGKPCSVEFLIGNTGLATRIGYLVGVGINYILLQDSCSGEVTVCDFFSIRFVRFFGEFCDPVLRR
ncbi:MAG: hypothetical protein GX076_06515 [Clostridiales bacterium]|nr:hypothetical protein [Clostridiales bacterium]